MAKKKDKDTLLVPVDFSLFSEKALLFASELAGKLKAKLLVLHVIHDPEDAPGFYLQKGKKKKFLRSMEESAEEMMEEFLNRMRETYPDHKPINNATTLLVMGIPENRIVEMAEKKKASMIIIGSHGCTGIGCFLLGSKAERIVRLSPIPVTVVKTSQES